MAVKAFDEEKRDPSILCGLRQVVKRYRRSDLPALGPIDLEVRQGEILGIRGENGAGKTTLIEILAGVSRPDQGRRWYAQGIKGHIGYIPQDLSLYETMTGLQNLKFWGMACGMPHSAIRTRSRWLLSMLHLEEKGKDLVETYSGGMKRRLHLASALMLTPRMLLLDEPTVGADADSAKVMLELLSHFQDQGCGIVLISHQKGELEKVSDRILTLKRGQRIA